eukprot:TRINITY_DN4884_c0_g1_i1.p1 TRINITY_DN4884_c0_g1~~TRINITY_DN4884_c0_g1_i1.p1  ORF type:complete len:400 (-),score=150.85 TRINITY_DN4884_c0_g1_i1:192-1304(-)
MNRCASIVALLLACSSLAFAQTWTPKQSMVFARSDFVPVNDGTAMYIGGGCNGNQTVSGICPSVTNYFTKYNFATNTWTVLTSMPRPRYRYSASIVGNKIYFVGGRTLSDSIISEVDVYDISANAWTTLPSQRGVTDFSDSVSFVSGTKMYVTGGYNANYDALNTTVVLDTADGTNLFRAGLVPNKPTRSGDSMAEFYNGKAYVIGGFTSDDGFCRPRNTLEVYDVASNTWTIKASMLAGRGDAAISRVKNMLFLLGGESKETGVLCASGPRSVPLDSVEYYSIDENMWRPYGRIAISRFRFGSSSYGNTVYDVGGQGMNTFNGTAEPYHPVIDQVWALDVSSVFSTSSAISTSTFSFFLVAALCLMALL